MDEARDALEAAIAAVPEYQDDRDAIDALLAELP